APAEGIDDYKGLDVRGKFVAILAGVPEGLPSEIAAHIGDDKGAAAARHGAIGLVTIYTSQYARVRPFGARASGAIRRSVLGWVGKDGAAGEDAPGLRASLILGDAAATALFAGARKSYAAVRAEAEKPKAHPRGF